MHQIRQKFKKPRKSKNSNEQEKGKIVEKYNEIEETCQETKQNKGARCLITYRGIVVKRNSNSINQAFKIACSEQNEQGKDLFKRCVTNIGSRSLLNNLEILIDLSISGNGVSMSETRPEKIVKDSINSYTQVPVESMLTTTASLRNYIRSKVKLPIRQAKSLLVSPPQSNDYNLQLISDKDLSQSRRSENEKLPDLTNEHGYVNQLADEIEDNLSLVPVQRKENEMKSNVVSNFLINTRSDNFQRHHVHDDT